MLLFQKAPSQQRYLSACRCLWTEQVLFHRCNLLHLFNIFHTYRAVQDRKRCQAIAFQQLMGYHRSHKGRSGSTLVLKRNFQRCCRLHQLPSWVQWPKPLFLMQRNCPLRKNLLDLLICYVILSSECYRKLWYLVQLGAMCSQSTQLDTYSWFCRCIFHIRRSTMRKRSWKWALWKRSCYTLTLYPYLR